MSSHELRRAKFDTTIRDRLVSQNNDANASCFEVLRIEPIAWAVRELQKVC